MESFCKAQHVCSGVKLYLCEHPMDSQYIFSEDVDVEGRIFAWPDTRAAKLKELHEMTPLAMASSLGDQLMHYMRSAVDRAPSSSTECHVYVWCSLRGPAAEGTRSLEGKAGNCLEQALVMI